MKLSQIATALNARLENGSPDAEITGLNGIEQASPSEITFVANPKYSAAAKRTKAAAVIVAENFPEIPPATLRVEDPYLSFARALELVPSSRCATRPEFIPQRSSTRPQR